MELTTLDGVLAAVPLLQGVCSTVLECDGPGSGLKLMRLVNRQLSKVMLDMVQGYTLQLSGKCTDMLNGNGLLESTKLCKLRVVVTAKADEVSIPGSHASSAHTLEVCTFIRGMGAAIKHVNCLEVDCAALVVQSEAVQTGWPSLLAAACPSLQQLQITGAISRGVLAAFGASCGNLHLLQVMDGIPDNVLEQLDQIMPHLSHCHIAARVPSNMHGHSLARPCCLSILASCASLTHVNIGASRLTPDMWHALPRGLRVLHCSLDERPPAGLSLLDSLRHLTCEYASADSVDLCSLSDILRVAPKMNIVDVCGVCMEGVINCDLEPEGNKQLSSRFSDLRLLHGLVKSGLEVNAIHIKQSCFHGVKLMLWDTFHDVLPDDDADMENCDVVGLLMSKPCFKAFVGLRLRCEFRSSSISLITQGIARGFPNLTHLEIDMYYCIGNDDWMHLKACKSLQHLCLENCRLDLTLLAMLCTYLQSLRVLRLVQCGELALSHAPYLFCDDSKAALQILLHVWGVNVKVLID